jgi:hypothetical protein
MLMHTLMKKNTSLLSLPTRILVACALWSGSALLSYGDVTLRGNIGARTINDNVIIPAYAACTLSGTVINGNVRVLAGARLQTKRARVNGDVQALDSFLVDLSQGTTVSGNVQGEGGTRSIVVRGGTRVTGNVELKDGFAPSAVDALLVQSAMVGGNVFAEKTNGRLRVMSSRIDGGVQFVENRRGPFTILSNQVRGDIQFFKNQGTNVINGTIIGNRVGGNLQSKENSPIIVVRSNWVAGAVEVE